MVQKKQSESLEKKSNKILDQMNWDIDPVEFKKVIKKQAAEDYHKYKDKPPLQTKKLTTWPPKVNKEEFRKQIVRQDSQDHQEAQDRKDKQKQQATKE